MHKNEIISATEASRGFSDLLHRVCYKGESFIIKKGSRLMARIVPVDEETIPQGKYLKKSRPKPETPKSTQQAAESLPMADMPQPQKNSPEEIPIEKLLPTSEEIAASTLAMSVPVGLTEEDVRFYENLIIKMGSNSG